MAYPKEVRERIEFLDKYKWNDKLDRFSIFHLYPDKLAYPNGYYDSRFFRLIGFNPETMEKRDLGHNHDGMTFWDNCPVAMIRIYADGSVLVKTSVTVETVGWSQDIPIRVPK